MSYTQIDKDYWVKNQYLDGVDTTINTFEDYSRFNCTYRKYVSNNNEKALIRFVDFGLYTMINLIIKHDESTMYLNFDEMLYNLPQETILYIQILDNQKNFINIIENNNFTKTLHLREHICVNDSFVDLLTYTRRVEL